MLLGCENRTIQLNGREKPPWRTQFDPWPRQAPQHKDPPSKLTSQIAGFLPRVEPVQCHTTWDETGPEGLLPVRVSLPAHPCTNLTHHCPLYPRCPPLLPADPGCSLCRSSVYTRILACPANPGHQNPDCSPLLYIRSRHECLCGWVCNATCTNFIRTLYKENQRMS